MFSGSSWLVCVFCEGSFVFVGFWIFVLLGMFLSVFKRVLDLGGKFGFVF